MRQAPVTLAGLLRETRPPGQIVALTAAGSHTWGAFTGHVAALAGRLRAAGRQRWLIFFDDSYDFAVALFAVAHSGGVAILPPNGQFGTIARLCDAADGFLLGDASLVADAAGEVIADPLAPLAPGAGGVELGDLDAEAPFVELFTSGSSGAGKRVAKRLRHLDEEVQALERTFGGGLAGASFFANVTHQHIYGALFRLLWPLASGRPFAARTYLHGGEVVGRMAAQPSVLVSSPVQLRAMAESNALRGLSPRAIFSSGAPLDDATAAAVASATGVAVTEIFGSTETGGVAWRQRPQGGDVAWRAFPDVELATADDGRLAVCSRLVSDGDDAGGGRHRFVMGDRVDVGLDGTFRLRGRADRIVKIGAKRLSLPEMEAELARHPAVAEAALVPIRRGLESRVAAAVVPSEHGRARLDDVGRAELGRVLTAALAPYFDRVTLPRVWRFVDALPRNAQGKLPEESVAALFAGDGGDGPPLDPVVEEETAAGNVLRRRCVVPRDLAYFAGHFEFRPIVPGVAHLRWAVDAGETLLGEPLRIAAVEALKFKVPLEPGAAFELEVEADADRRRLRFRLWRDEGEISTGRIVLAREIDD